MNTTKVLFAPPSDALRFLPEGPYPLGNGKFSWVAIQHGPNATSGSLNVYDLETNSNESFPLAGRPGFAFPTDRGNFVVGCERSIGIYDPETRCFTVLFDGIDGECDGTIVNDGVTWDGNLIFGTKDLEFKTKKAGLYFFRGADRKLFRLRSDQICSNGKVVVPVDSTHVDLLDIDTPTKKVVAYRIDTQLGKIESERTVVDLADDIAFPDGMTVTPSGKSIIISFYNPNPAAFGRTVQFSISTGEVEQTWQTMGSPQATCPQFVSWQNRLWLIITTAVEHMSPERRVDSPEAGSLFIVETPFEFEQEAYDRMTPVFREPNS